MKISDRLIAFRKENQLTVARMALLVGVDAVTIWRWETGKTPGPRYRKDIARVLNMTEWEIQKTYRNLCKAMGLPPRNPHRKKNVIFLDILCGFLNSERYADSLADTDMYCEGYNAALNNVKQFATDAVKEKIMGKDEDEDEEFLTN